jgi:predicted RNA-binding protein with PIN domain
MPYIIDGHNLIPESPGLDLQDIDDELQLIEMLQEFCRLRRKQVEIYFDNAPPGQLRVQKFGHVTAFFARAGQSADQAISQKLHLLGKKARAARATVISSQNFAIQLMQTIANSGTNDASSKETVMSPQELEEWLKLFGEDDNQG